jgi:hypothetical protein
LTTIYVDNRDDLPDRIKDDVYVTEKNLIRAAYEEFITGPVSNVLDAGAGDGRWGSLLLEYVPTATLTGVELRSVEQPSEFDIWHNKTSFLDWAPLQTQCYDLVVSNPPYKFAEEFVRLSWDLLVPGGQMLFLLRLAFQASKKRYEGLWSEIWPTEVAVCSLRPSFYGGGTNGTDYGVYYWEKDETTEKPVGAPRLWVTSLLLHERDDDGEV